MHKSTPRQEDVMLHSPPNETWQANYQLKHYNTALKHTTRRRHAVDIGAHIGIFTRRYAQDFEQVTAIEPVNYEYLIKNTLDLDNVKVIAKGCGSRETTLYAHNPGTLTAHTELTEQHSNIAIEVIALDSLQLKEVDLIKIDTQGLEQEVLRGAQGTVALWQPTIHIETRDVKLIEWIENSFGYKRVDKYIKDWVIIPV